MESEGKRTETRLARYKNCCAFLTYFSPDSTNTAANSPTSGAQAALYNDKQSITGVAYPCGALSVRRMRWRHQQQQHQRQLYCGPYARLQQQHQRQQQQQQQQHELQLSSGLGLISASATSRSNLREICKTHAIC
ncbi:hypothetical protein AWZ03_007816 [Drosophila navojoa]|uniref:Uncharacterized protein n=1 Tax=Drosophila navojoa TaxID=7232 RepID=A0A484BBU9_DRONA|nr:hypothetical protein AWZ03_007816 [Drosophila navojoa]